MKKRVIAAFLTAVLAVSMLSGCGSGGKKPENEKAESTKGDEPGNAEEIVFAYMTQNNIPEASELQRIEDLINEYLSLIHI